MSAKEKDGDFIRWRFYSPFSHIFNLEQTEQNTYCIIMHTNIHSASTLLSTQKCAKNKQLKNPSEQQLDGHVEERESREEWPDLFMLRLLRLQSIK